METKSQVLYFLSLAFLSFLFQTLDSHVGNPTASELVEAIGQQLRLDGIKNILVSLCLNFLSIVRHVPAGVSMLVFLFLFYLLFNFLFFFGYPELEVFSKFLIHYLFVGFALWEVQFKVGNLDVFTEGYISSYLQNLQFLINAISNFFFINFQHF